MQFLSIINDTDDIIHIRFYDGENNELHPDVTIDPSDEVTHQVKTNAGTLELEIESSQGEWSGKVPLKIGSSLIISKNQDEDIYVSYNGMELPGETHKKTWSWLIALMILVVAIACVAGLYYLKKSGKDVMP